MTSDVCSSCFYVQSIVIIPLIFVRGGGSGNELVQLGSEIYLPLLQDSMLGQL